MGVTPVKRIQALIHPENWVRRLPSRVTIACCVIFCAACLAVMSSAIARGEESLTYLETAGRYADMRDEIETRLGRGVKNDSTLLSYLCISYGKLKQYKKLFDCFNFP